MDRILYIDNLKKRYGHLEAVKGISLKVYRGEIFGFLGPNGAGKTTTIKCCAGLLRPNKGSISVGNFDITIQPEKAKALTGYVPDNPFLYEKLTGMEFALFVSRLHGSDNNDFVQRAENYFELFEMKDSKDELIQSYSRGMRQKVSLISALVHQPDLLMVDEPTANLDPKSARLVKDIFQSLKVQGKAIFISTHVMEIAESLCDRIAIIHKGEIKATGTMEELRMLQRGETLEDIFLEITGGHDPKTRKVLESLTQEEDKG